MAGRSASPRRWLFDFDGHAAGAESPAAEGAGEYLAECTRELEREIELELEYALPSDCRAEVTLRMAGHRPAWSGTVAIRSRDGTGVLPGVDVTLVESLVHLAIDHAIAEQAALFGLHAVRTRARGAPRADGLSALAEVDPLHESLAALDDRLQRQSRFMMAGFGATLVLMMMLVAGLIYLGVHRGRDADARAAIQRTSAPADAPPPQEVERPASF